MEEGPHTPHRIMHPHRHVITIKIGPQLLM
jgi:hypothetical protein